MSRKIIAYENYYKDFFDTLDKGTQEKVLYGLLLLKTQDRLPAKYVKFLKEGLYELRIEWQGNIYRIFFCYDEGHIVILFNGFQKKTQKTPDREIDKALKLKKNIMSEKELKMFDVDAQLDAVFGKEGTPERKAAEDRANAFFTGQIIEEARKKANMTQAELAEKIGTNKSYISRVETGKTEPKVSTFYRIASALGLNVELTPAM